MPPAPAPPSEYHLDAADRIVYVSPAFLEFAAANDAPGLNASALLGREIWDFITGAPTREIYAVIFDWVRTTQQFVTLPFRCDSPTVRRFMELGIAPGLERQLYLTAILKRTEQRPAVALLDPRVPRSDIVLEACSFCRAIHVADAGWMEVEAAIRHLNLFDSPQLPALSHGVCPNCLPEFRRRLGL